MKGNDYLEVVSIRLVKDAPILSKHRICSPEDAVAVLGDLMAELDKEVICVVNLKADNTPINCYFASMGSVNQSIACPRELFKSSILSNASGMILVHNHPSGSLHPSREDIELTERMIYLCSIMGIPLVDHLIVGGNNREYFSFKKKGLLDNPYLKNCTDNHIVKAGSSMPKERGR